MTNAAGVYRFPAVPPSTYTMSAELEGFQPAQTPEFRVNVSSDLTVDIPMQLEVGEEIVVTGEVPLISITASDSSSVVTDEWIGKLPVGRDFAGVITQVGGSDYQPDKSGARAATSSPATSTSSMRTRGCTAIPGRNPSAA